MLRLGRRRRHRRRSATIGIDRAGVGDGPALGVAIGRASARTAWPALVVAAREPGTAATAAARTTTTAATARTTATGPRPPPGPPPKPPGPRPPPPGPPPKPPGPRGPPPPGPPPKPPGPPPPGPPPKPPGPRGPPPPGPPPPGPPPRSGAGATGPAGATAAGTAAGAARTTSAGAATGPATEAAGAARTTSAARRTAGGTPVIATAVARTTAGRAGHHPAGTCHRASARNALIAISIATRAELEATRLVAAGTVGSAYSAGAAARLPAAATTAAIVPSGTAASAIVAPGLTARHEVDEVVKVALLLGAGRRIFSAHHAHEPNVVGAVADHLERLHQARQTILFDPELLLDLGRGQRGSWIGSGVGRRTRVSRPPVTPRIHRRSLHRRWRPLRPPRMRSPRPRLLARSARLDRRLLARSARLDRRLLRGALALDGSCSLAASGFSDVAEASASPSAWAWASPEIAAAIPASAPAASSRGVDSIAASISAPSDAAGSATGFGGGAGRCVRRTCAASRSKIPENSVTVFIVSSFVGAAPPQLRRRRTVLYFLVWAASSFLYSSVAFWVRA